MTKDVVTVWHCKCKKNYIILDEEMMGTELSLDEVLCPVCGNEAVSSYTKDMTIGSVRDDKEVWDKVLTLKNRMRFDSKGLDPNLVGEITFLLKLLDE